MSHLSMIHTFCNVIFKSNKINFNHDHACIECLFSLIKEEYMIKFKLKHNINNNIYVYNFL